VGKLVAECVGEIKEYLVVGKTKMEVTTAEVDINRGGISAEAIRQNTLVYEPGNIQLPDIISYLQNETALTRKTLVDILVKSERLDDFKHNPQGFIDGVMAIIKKTMRRFIVDGIKYQKVGDDFYYAQELFEEEELVGYLSKNILKVDKSVYDHVVYDSDVEANFAAGFERNEHVKLYAKLPGWFKIDTPLGPYNPDWAVLVEKDGKERLYFVVETKGSLFADALRPAELAKVKCGKAHFEALNTDVHYTMCSAAEDFMDKVDI
jgi:type III restriction enzyme